MWVQIFKIPLHVWGYEFLEALTKPLGRLICRDDDTRDKVRFDRARILLEVNRPWCSGKEIWIQVDDSLHKVILVPEFSGCGFGGMQCAGNHQKPGESSDSESSFAVGDNSPMSDTAWRFGDDSKVGDCGSPALEGAGQEIQIQTVMVEKSKTVT